MRAFTWARLGRSFSGIRKLTWIVLPRSSRYAMVCNSGRLFLIGPFGAPTRANVESRFLEPQGNANAILLWRTMPAVALLPAHRGSTSVDRGAVGRCYDLIGVTLGGAGDALETGQSGAPPGFRSGNSRLPCDARDCKSPCVRSQHPMRSGARR